MSYSQGGEEEVLLAHFRGRRGRLLDIGAYDGRTFSNSLALIEREWEAVLVEPSARAFDALMRTHAETPGVRLVQALVVPDASRRLCRFWQCPDALSTTEDGNRETWERAGTEFSETWTPSVSVRRLLRFCGAAAPFDFVTIDTEGTSGDVFRALMAEGAKPEVICVEHDGRDVSYPGYVRTFFDGNNTILKRTR